MTIKFGNITKTLTGKIRLQRRSKMKTGVLRSSNPYLKISLTINHQLCTFLRDKTTSLPCPSHTLCISQEHTNEATCTRQHSRTIQFLYYFINRVFSPTWPASMQIYWNKRERLHKKRVQLPEDWFGTPTWPPFLCFGTPIWPP